MKKANKLASILTGIAMSISPVTQSYSQVPPETINPVKQNTIVSSNIVPVKNLKKTIDYSTMKPVQELQEGTVSYIDRNEGIQMGYSYVPSEDKFYDKSSSEKIISYHTENTNGYYGDIFLNPFVQPNYENSQNFHLSYYGSGNVAGANGTESDVLDWDDYNAILGSNMEEADVNGDGTPGTQADKDMLENYLTDQIPYLPAHYEFHKTTSEKESWFENYYNNVEQTDTIPPVGGWDCDNYAMQFHINSSGIENISGAFGNPDVYDTTNNCQGNMMVYQVSTVSQNNVAHGINAILVGENPTNFNDWYFYEPQNDTRVYPGTPSMGPNSFANIKKYVYFWSNQYNQYFYNMNLVINFDLNNGNATVTSQDPDLVTQKPSKLNYIHIGGQKPADVTVNVEDGLNPNVTGEATGYADWASAYYSDDSTTQAGSTWDSTFYNYQLFRSWKAESDSSNIIDTTYASTNPIYGRPAQIITVQDTAKPVFTYVYGNQSMDYTEWLNNGIPASQGSDNSGVFAINRSMASGQGTNPDSCNYWTFPVDVTDSIYDPSNNWRVENFTVDVEMEDSYFTNFPGPQQIQYADPITPDMTGGLPGAQNPTGVQVYVDQNPSQVNSTQNPDPTKKAHYWYGFDWNHNASDSVCVNPIYQTQHVTVVETNPPYWTFVPSDTLVEEGTNLHPDNLGWSVAADSITPVTPSVTYEDELIEEIPNVQRLWERHWYAEDLSGTNAPDTSTFITEDLETGIRNNLGSLEKKLYFYPNPTSGVFKIRYQAEKPSRVAAEIYDATGRLVDNSLDTYLPGESELEFDISDKAPGLYFIQLSVDGVPIFEEKISNRIIKK
jgi:hypothetical protein